MYAVAVIYRTAWLVPVLAGAVAWEMMDIGPSCTRPAARYSSNIAFCDVDGSKLTLDPIGEAGLYRAHLLDPENHCWVQGLDIQLHYYSLNQSQCNLSDNLHSESVMHSHQMFECPPGEFLSSDVFSNGVPVPKVNLTSILEFVYGGCYLLTLNVKYNNAELTKDNAPLPKENFFWISNNYTKKEFKKSLNLTTFATTTISSSDPVITFLFRYKVQKYYSLSLFDADENEMDITEWCSLQYVGATSEVNCKLSNDMAPGNYTIDCFANAGFCGGQIFQKHCRYSVNFTILDAVKKVNAAQAIHHDYRQDVITVAVVAAFSLVVLLVTIAGYYQYAKRRILSDQAKILLSRAKFRPVDTAPKERDPADELKAIVLVYARDCEPFMEVMRLLKKMLEERCGVKVYDIFDTAVFNSEVAASPHDWAVSVLSTAGVRVVLVKTPCGELLYESMMIESANGLQLCEAALASRVQYRVPRYTDTLLLLLFRLIKDDAVLPGSYLKYFVVQITNFYGVRQLPEVNPYKRYELPGAAELLLAELRARAPSAAPTPAARELRAAVDALAAHVRANPDYVLDDLLHVDA